MRKIIKSILISFLGLLLLPKTALGFGITPAEIYIEDLKPGGHLERQIYVTRPPDEVNEALNVTLETDLGEMENWFSFIPGREFPFPIGKNVTSFKVIVDVPRGADIKNFGGRIVAKGTSGKRASAGVTIIKGAILGVDITTSDSDAPELKVLTMEAPDVNKGDPVRLLVNVENVGNVAAALDRIDLEVMDLFEKPLENLSDTTLPKIDPFSTKQFQADFNSNLDKGQYRIDASAIFMGKEIYRKKMILTVNAKPTSVEEEGEYGREGKLMLLQRGVTGTRFVLVISLIGLLLLLLILLMLLMKDRETDPVYKKKLSKLIKEKKLLTLVLLVVSIAMIYFGLYQYLKLNAINRARMQNSQGTTINDQAGSVSEESSTPSSEVRGVSTQVVGVFDEVDDKTTLKVNRPGTPGLYPIFSEPNFGAEIIYEAEAGETFDVIDQNGDWYNVLMEDGASGWLHQMSVKSQ